MPSEQDKASESTLKSDDRVMDRFGLKGTVLSVSGELVTVRFDTSMKETVAAKKLTKIVSDSGK